MSIGQGTLRVTLGYPTGPFTHAYHFATPRLFLDGVERADIGWGQHDLALPAGLHAVKILVYAADGDAFGLAETPVAIALGERTDLVYRAPRLRGPRGRVKV